MFLKWRIYVLIVLFDLIGKKYFFKFYMHIKLKFFFCFLKQVEKSIFIASFTFLQLEEKMAVIVHVTTVNSVHQDVIFQ